MYLQRSPQLIRARLPWVVGQAGLVAAAVFIYFRIRGLTESSVEVARAHAHHIMTIERFFGIDFEARLQSAVAPSESLETLANWIYIWGHWPVIIATMIWLAWQHRAVFLRLRDSMMLSGALGMLVFVTLPVAPPRLAGLGMEDTVSEHSHAYRVLQPPAFVNQYAAMPSLHTGWDLLVGISIVTAATSLALKLVGFTMPMLMAFAVVATANHYILDVLAGVMLVLVGHVIALRFEQQRHRHPRSS